MTAITVTKTASPMRRLLRLARPMRSQLLLAVLAGAVGCGCGVALLAVSGFLLARASQHPNIVAISVAVVMVRALSVGRGLLRYLERLFSHDVAFRVLADVRVAIYRRLERLAPAGLAAFRSGDMLTRLISDVDSTQDLFIRGIAPPLTAALVGAGATPRSCSSWPPRRACSPPACWPPGSWSPWSPSRRPAGQRNGPRPPAATSAPP